MCFQVVTILFYDKSLFQILNYWCETNRDAVQRRFALECWNNLTLGQTAILTILLLCWIPLRQVNKKYNARYDKEDLIYS